MTINRMFIVWGVSLALSAAPLVANAIGRSGNGKIRGDEDGFETQVPRPYVVSQDIGRGALRLLDPIRPMGSAGLASFIELRRLSVEFPELTSKTRPEFVDTFVQGTWSQVASNNPCLEVLRSESKSALAMIVAWGPGRGVVILAPRSALAEQAAAVVLHSITIDPGACSWN